MTRLLAFDTTTDLCSVALHCGTGGVFEHSRSAPRLHNRYLLEMIDGVIRAASTTSPTGPTDSTKVAIDYIAFGAGPGSFTGVRIGAAVAQGLGFAIDAKVVRVPSSLVAAEAARRSGLRGEFSICRQSKAGWHYSARYQLDDHAECLSFDQLAPDAGTEGTAAREHAVDGDVFPVDARLIAELALSRLDDAVAASAALPFYVDGDSPWRPNN